MSPVLADTLKEGDVSHVSCSMYDPSVEAKYFHSLVMFTDALTLDTCLFCRTVSTIFCTNACFSSCGTAAGSFVTGVDQYCVYAGTGASLTSTFFATALAFAMSAAMRVMRRISSSVTFGLLANPHTPL